MIATPTAPKTRRNTYMRHITLPPVGTNGYTAPEVLKGQHYGTPADVFSFAIVMSEMVTLRPPYANMMEGDGAATLGQIVEMTK